MLGVKRASEPRLRPIVARCKQAEVCCVQVHIGSEQMETEVEKKRKPAKSVILAQPRRRPKR